MHLITTHRYATLLVGALAILAGCATAHPTPDPAGVEYVLLRTSKGDIAVELDEVRAPISTANFLGYVDRHDYDGTIFHRVIPAFVVQGGGFTADLAELKSGPPIKDEWQNGLKNTRGTLAMARDEAPDTATREFYFNVADNPKLDTPRDKTGRAGYAVFGHVVRGMDVLDAIRVTPTTTRQAKEEMKDVPVTPIVLLTAHRCTRAEALGNEFR